jgi:CHAT domain-containing protein
MGFGNPILTGAQGAGVNSVKASGPMTPIAYTSVWRGPAADINAIRSGLAPLPETETELRTIANRLSAGDDSVKLGKDATETAVKSADLSHYRIVYFATHGLIAGEVQGLGEPALVFSLPDAPTEMDDGLLTASEVTQLHLDAEWVVLSACNTAAGQTPGAEALSGLARAFFHAGTRAMLVSHWRVGSEAAAQLTTSSFEILQSDPHMGRAEAVRRAMMKFADDAKDPWNAYPTFWAPFSVVGEGNR